MRTRGGRDLGRSAALAAGFLVALLVSGFAALPAAQSGETLRVAVLKFGTVNWQLDTLKTHGFDSDAGFDLEVLPLASKNAVAVALQAGEVDLIVTDWIWALRQRAAGLEVAFVPYSTALGALMLRRGLEIADLRGLSGRRVGVAGGPVDKSWLILRHWAESRMDFDIATAAEVVYAAPPLLNEQLRAGQLDAVLTFWPYAARLEAQGFDRHFGVSDLLADLDIGGRPSLIGYLFRTRSIDEKEKTLRAFFGAVAKVNGLLAGSNSEWRRLRPIMKAGSDEEFEALKAGYRAGIPVGPGGAELEKAGKLYELLASAGGEKLLGPGTRFDPDVFWRP